MMKHFLITAFLGLALVLGTSASLDARGGGGGGGGGHGGGGGGHGGGGFGGGGRGGFGGGYGGGFGRGGYGGFGGFGYGGFGYGGFGYGGFGYGGLGYGGYGWGGGFYPGFYGGGYYGSPYYYPPYGYPLYGSAPATQDAPALADKPANIRLIVPDAQAKVIFNDHVTASTGTERNFHTTGLAPGKTYTYRVHASWMKDGQEMSQDRLVDALPGQTVVVDFNAPANAKATLLTPAVAQKPANIRLFVPDADAKVVFNGHQTTSLGTERNFHTPALVPGKTYTYKVSASWKEDGAEVTQERLVEALPGQTVVVDFNATTATAAQSVVIPASLNK